MIGYLKNDQATRDTLDDEGFLHSGIGTIDAQLSILPTLDSLLGTIFVTYIQLNQDIDFHNRRHWSL